MDKISPRQHKAALLLASGRSGREAASQVGVSPETVCKWKQSVYFKAVMNELQAEQVEVGRLRMRALTEKAIDVVQDLLEAGASESIKAKVSLSLLKLNGVADPKGFEIGSSDYRRVLHDEVVAEVMTSQLKI